jgi:hypothetical protein
LNLQIVINIGKKEIGRGMERESESERERKMKKDKWKGERYEER